MFFFGIKLKNGSYLGVYYVGSNEASFFIKERKLIGYVGWRI